MGTNYIAPIWRMPENTNKDNLSNYSINFDGASRTQIGIGEVVGGPLLPGGGTYTSNVTVQNPKFSGSAFINFDTSSTYPVGNIIGVGQVGGASFWFFRKNANNNIEFIVRTDAGPPYYATVTGSTVLNANQWYHAAFSWDGNTITLYLNGSVDGSGSATTFYNSSYTYSGYASIGSYWRGGININTQWVGELSQVSIFDYALDSTQITYLYNLNNPMVIPGGEPIAYWPLGDNSNPNAPGSYPNISVGADSVFNFVRTNTDSIDLGQAQNLAGEFSISVWIKPDVLDFSQVVLGHDAFNWIRLNSANEITFRINGGGGSSDENFNALAGISLQTGVWQHLFFNRDSSNNIRAYKNGSLFSADTNNNSDTFIISKIGTRGAVYYDGEISNVQVWNKDLTGPEIITLYNNGQPLMTGTQPQAANLKAWYKLNQYDSYWDLGGNGKWTFNNAAIN